VDYVDEQAPGRRPVALSRAWPASFALLALAAALAMAALVGGIVLAVTRLVGGVAAGEDNPAGVLAATAVQDVVFVGTAVALGSLAGRVTKADLGLCGRPLGRVLRVTALTGAAFLVFSVVYDLIVRPEAQQDTLDDLGADRGTIWLVLTGLLVVGVAPFAEELLFRGFMYRCLRNRFTPLIASAGVGLLFGAVHFDGVAVLPLLPILAVFGALLCVAYERSGTLYSPIILHAINNAITFAVTGPRGAAIVAPAVLAVSVTVSVSGVRGRATAAEPAN
jgi:membrane protease YdiL (CAAX protease family)